MAWWVHAVAVACPVQSEDNAAQPAASDVSWVDPAPRGGLLPRWMYRRRLARDDWRAMAASAVAAAASGSSDHAGGASDGELTLMVARSDGDPRVRIPALRSLTVRWRLLCAWRARGGERGACFGVGGGRMWGEDFFLLDADC